MKKSDLTEFAVEEENFKLQIKRASETQAQPQVVSYAPPAPRAPQPHAQAVAAAGNDDNATYITSPMVGTFYTAPSPESDAFVKVGDSVQPDTVACIIEAMKIMNEIQSEESGVVAEILVEDGQPVEFGQRLYRLS